MIDQGSCKFCVPACKEFDHTIAAQEEVGPLLIGNPPGKALPWGNIKTFFQVDFQHGVEHRIVFGADAGNVAVVKREYAVRILIIFNIAIESDQLFALASTSSSSLAADPTLKEGALQQPFELISFNLARTPAVILVSTAFLFGPFKSFKIKCNEACSLFRHQDHLREDIFNSLTIRPFIGMILNGYFHKIDPLKGVIKIQIIQFIVIFCFGDQGLNGILNVCEIS